MEQHNMIISRQNLAILSGVAKVQENIYNLDHVMIDIKGGCLYASDGHCLYRSNLDVSLNDEDFPSFDIENTGDKENMFIHGRELLKAEKNIPKRQAISALENIQILTDKDYHHIITTDIETVNTVKVKKSSKEFPGVEEIEKAYSGKPDSHAWVSVQQLEKLTKALKKNGCDEVKLELRGAENPLVAKTSDKVFVGYVMPLNVD